MRATSAPSCSHPLFLLRAKKPRFLFFAGCGRYVKPRMRPDSAPTRARSSPGHLGDLHNGSLRASLPADGTEGDEATAQQQPRSWLGRDRVAVVLRERAGIAVVGIVDDRDGSQAGIDHRRACPAMCKRNLVNFLNVVDWNMDFFVCNAALVTRKDWSHSAVNGAGFAPVAAPGAWPKG